jgi:tRNA pseudouridine13 synthase
VNGLIPPFCQLLQEMPCANGRSLGTGLIRSSADDFQVDEQLGFAPDGEGEHVLLRIRKRDTNTIWLAKQIARLAGVPPRDVSYAGLKDRHAVTTQWFSVRLAGKPEPDWSQLNSDLLELLEQGRHRRKLRRGALQGNRFCLTVRQLQADRGSLEARLQRLRYQGAPNFFGEQRFGHGYGNLAQADAMFAGSAGRLDRKLRGLLISAARSQLFNAVLAKRIARGDWQRPLPGERLVLDGCHSSFLVDELDQALLSRCEALDVHPSGPLWGRGESLVEAEARELESAVLAPFESWRTGLEFVGLEQERRALRMRLDDLQWEFPQPDQLVLSFGLEAGSYATMVLRELLEVTAPAPQ